MSDPSPAGKTAAFFDVDGTLAGTTIAHYYAYFMRRRLSPARARLWEAGFLARCCYYLVLDRLDRGRLNQVFYRNYAGLPAAAIKEMAEDCHRAVTLPRQYPGAMECVAGHRKEGDIVVFVTGSLDFIIEPLAREVGAVRVLAARLAEDDGVFTGALTGPPFGSEEKARLVRELAERESLDLARSHSYGDSIADLGLLEAVGHPHAVNPDRRLSAIARARGWPVHRWTRAGAASQNGQ